MATDSTLAEAPGSLSGVARVLVNAGKLDAKAAENLTRSAKDQKRSFVSTLVASGAINPDDLAHTLSKALSVPVMDLSAIDLNRLPKGVIDNKLSNQYQVLVLSRRGSRLFVAGADPTDQEAIERIKFSSRPSGSSSNTTSSPRSWIRSMARPKNSWRPSPRRISSSTSPTTSACPRPTRPRSPLKSKTPRWCASCRRC
jgi:hypothetical protein